MGEPMPKSQDPDDGLYEFACVRCGVSEVLTLTSRNEAPRCRCGSPLSAIALVADTSADQDVCGEAFLKNICQESKPLNNRYDGLCLVQGRGGHPEDATDETPEYSPLDHPHVEPHCQFCAIRQQRSSQHRLWCRIFLFRECNCGYERG
jgi:hypothetical protein